MGLNESSQILPMDPIHDMNKVFSSFDQHERQNNFEVIEDRQMILNAIDGRFTGTPCRNSSCSAERGRRNSEVCSYCGKLGHTMETSYRKHGFAPGFLVQKIIFRVTMLRQMIRFILKYLWLLILSRKNDKSYYGGISRIGIW
jgi:hypothetical protein